MASGVKLVLGFETAEGKSMTLTYNHAKPSATAAQVKALMEGIITNGSIFSTAPVTAKSATKVVTEESEYDLSA